MSKNVRYSFTFSQISDQSESCGSDEGSLFQSETQVCSIFLEFHWTSVIVYRLPVLVFVLCSLLFAEGDISIDYTKC